MKAIHWVSAAVFAVMLSFSVTVLLLWWAAEL